ncbi:hypothetical protein ACSW8Q_16160 (plasmid) [Clostridium perfringens]|uniref:Uncharacterized protein n=1 Tax=Clostridium perfringens E str. JGS1987 TaxID=451755 RepID=B1BU23_CLOPF|nr:hypothetical protein [Clostridium perfringens]EDT14824.1 hypothetical protein AC3_0165 [Clostridium perfringens E str. JGS1987]MDT7988936.1 hypothetical protein [Clostridium perfringens]WVM62165.1 hypothetical protein V1657_15695 [Clostridium perfringens]
MIILFGQATDGTVTAPDGTKLELNKDLLTKHYKIVLKYILL